MKNLNRKGFTLVELLSVIVILSVIVLIATNAVVPMADSAKKQVLAMEANSLVKALRHYIPRKFLQVQNVIPMMRLFQFLDLIEKNE